MIEQLFTHDKESFREFAKEFAAALREENIQSKLCSGCSICEEMKLFDARCPKAHISFSSQGKEASAFLFIVILFSQII